MYFTYKRFHSICKKISEVKQTIKANEIHSQSTGEAQWIIFKHDVETNVGRALKMAEIEHEYGIKATYYVQGYLLEDESNIPLLKKMAELGHEVTYHYDVLDANNGDYDKAKEEFVDYVNTFEKHGFKIETLCPHGNPVIIRDGWNSNKDFFRNKAISEEFNTMLDVVVHLPELLNSDYTYISDAGFQFKIIVNVESNDIGNNGDIVIGSLNEFVNLCNDNKKVILSTHPHRWRSSLFAAYSNRLKFRIIRAAAMLGSKNKWIKKLLSKFYFLAKKI